MENNLYETNGYIRKIYESGLDNTTKQILIVKSGVSHIEGISFVETPYVKGQPKRPDLEIRYDDEPMLAVELEEQRGAIGDQFSEGTFERKRENTSDIKTFLFTFNKDYTMVRIIEWGNLSKEPHPTHKLPSGERFVHAIDNDKVIIKSTEKMLKGLESIILRKKKEKVMGKMKRVFEEYIEENPTGDLAGFSKWLSEKIQKEEWIKSDDEAIKREKMLEMRKGLDDVLEV